MTFQISQRGNQYLKTAQTLLRAAQTMTTEQLRVSLRPLPTTTNGERRRLRMLTRPKHWLARLLALNAIGNDPMAASQDPTERLGIWRCVIGRRMGLFRVRHWD